MKKSVTYRCSSASVFIQTNLTLYLDSYRPLSTWKISFQLQIDSALTKPMDKWKKLLYLG